MVLPFVEVSHLPQSTSFYSAVLQPLGLCYLSTDREQTSSIGTVTYGYKPGALGQDRPIPILQLREAAHPLEPLKFSSLVLTAPSHDAVVDFHACGLDANPWLRIQQNDDGSPAYPGPSGRPRLGIDGGVSRATICDLDGNMMEVIYPPPSGGSRPATYNGVPIRQTQSNRDEAVRILDWNYDVAARSVRAASHHSSTTSSHRSQALTQLPVRPRYPSSRSNPAGSVVSAAMSQRAHSRHSDDAEPAAEPSVSPRQSSTKSSLNTTNVVGALLGVAAGAVAGAAFMHGMVNKEKERRPRHEQDHPMLPRRSTYPEKLPRAPHHSDRHSAYGDYPPRVAALPYPQDYDYGRPRAPYQEDYPPQPLPYQGGYAPQPVPYHDEYAPRTMPNYAPRTMLPVEDDDSTSESEDEVPPEPHRRPVHYLTEKSHHSTAPKSTTRSTARSVARSRAIVDDEDEAYDTRSRHSSKHKTGRAPSTRPRSEAPVSRALAINDEDRHSRAVSRHTTAPKSTHSQARSHRPQYDHDRDSYFSAKSRRSGATTRQQPPVPELVEQEIVTRSRSGSRVTTTKLAYQQGRPVTMDRSSKAPSRVSARNIGLPMSNLGSSHANWDDDMDSVAPSDSISCIGSKTSRRSRRARA